MEIGKVVAIVMKRNKSWEGIIVDGEFTAYDEYTGDIPTNYLPLFEYLRLWYPKVTKKEAEIIRKSLGYTTVHIHVEDADDFWAHFNHKCNTCKKPCKQSSKVEVVSCPQYEFTDD